jgi:phosphoribosylaminoimidazole-succinocarboxamide synthase
METQKAIVKTDIHELKKLFSGKVRDIYEISEKEWLIVTTDRISAFDVVFQEGILEKGKILNRISNIWFSKMKQIKNHLVSEKPEEKLPFLKNYEGIPERSVLIRKLNRLPIECVVRGYLFGSVYEEYEKNGTAGGNPLPKGLKLAQDLPEPIFTPSTKAEVGHDENINYSEFLNIVGKEVGHQIRDASIELYRKAKEIMKKKGIILADTKFEFGLDEKGELILVDEVLTPDSSRYWEGESYRIGESPKSFDKQFVRDYLIQIKWDKKPPAPPLPSDIIQKTREKYLQIQNIIEGI